MKKGTITVVLYYLASICFFISAIIGFANDSSSATVHICLGAAMLCLGTAYVNRSKKNEKQEKQDKEEEQKK